MRRSANVTTFGLLFMDSSACLHAVIAFSLRASVHLPGVGGVGPVWAFTNCGNIFRVTVQSEGGQISAGTLAQT